MAEENIAFKSFYYSLGTTSFRMQNFNQKIEEQLDLLNQFWQKDEYKNEKKVYFDGDKSAKAILQLYEASDLGNVKTHWRKFLFKTMRLKKTRRNNVSFA